MMPSWLLLGYGLQTNKTKLKKKIKENWNKKPGYINSLSLQSFIKAGTNTMTSNRDMTFASGERFKNKLQNLSKLYGATHIYF